MTRRPTVRSAREGYSASNLLAAGLVLANIALYGGEQAALVQWARLVQAKAAERDEARIGPLFQAACRRLEGAF